MSSVAPLMTISTASVEEIAEKLPPEAAAKLLRLSDAPGALRDQANHFMQRAAQERASAEHAEREEARLLSTTEGREMTRQLEPRIAE